MPIPTVIRLLAILGAGVVGTAAADEHRSDPRIEIARRLEVGVEAVRASALPGIYEVARGAEVLYVSGDGRYALVGELYDTEHGTNLTAQRRTAARRAALLAVPDTDAIIFEPKHLRYTVTVFTDVDCAYCRRLHSEIAEYNRRGVRVRYLFYPRSGPGSESWKKAEAVWCAADRRQALTLAKAGGALPQRSCGATAISSPTPAARGWCIFMRRAATIFSRS